MVYWGILAYTGIYCGILEYTGIYYCILEYTGIYCCILGYNELYCDISSHVIQCCEMYLFLLSVFFLLQTYMYYTPHTSHTPPTHLPHTSHTPHTPPTHLTGLLLQGSSSGYAYKPTDCKGSDSKFSSGHDCA